MGRKESVDIIRHIPDSVLRLTILVYQSLRDGSASDRRVLRSLQFIEERYRGRSMSESAEAVGISRKTGYNIQRAWNERGIEGVIPRFSNGPKPRLTPEQVLEIEGFLASNEVDISGLRRHVSESYGVSFSDKHLRTLFLGRGLRYARDIRR